MERSVVTACDWGRNACSEVTFLREAAVIKVKIGVKIKFGAFVPGCDLKRCLQLRDKLNAFNFVQPLVFW